MLDQNEKQIKLKERHYQDNLIKEKIEYQKKFEKLNLDNEFDRIKEEEKKNLKIENGISVK